MPESVIQRTAGLAASRDAKEMQKVIDALRADVVQLRSAITTLCAKLDADAGVTDTNYAALVSTTAMGSLNTTP